MDICIIGGGASGMLLASMLDKNNVTIFEKNSKLGKKLLLTGNGKCNFTNEDFDDVHKIYNNDFAINSFYRYNNNKFIEYLSSIGVESYINRHRGIGFYYPITNKSSSVYYALYDKINSNKVNIKLNFEVKKIIKNKNKFVVFVNDCEYEFDKVVIATGGKSYSVTGSTGDGYEFSKKFGHSIIKPLPALCGYTIKGFEFLENKGVRIYLKVYAINDNTKEIIASDIGEVQFSKKTISGYPIMNISRIINRKIDNGDKIIIKLDLTYGIKGFNDVNYLVHRKEFLQYRKKKDFLSGIIDDNIANYIFKYLHINNLNLSVKTFSFEELFKIYNLLSNFKISICESLKFDDAQLTSGGIDTSEIDIDTFESKLVKGLYFIGEVIDIDGKCGGYNLQLCFSSASIVYNSIGGGNGI